MPLDSFSVSVGENASLEHFDGDPEAASAWRLVHLDPAPGFVGALASRTGGPRIALETLG